MKCSQIWHKRKIGGFSLVELMVVVAIIGILAALALPRFRIFQAKSRQTEAKNNLLAIYTLEEAYRADHDEYAAFDEVGGDEGKCKQEGNPIGFVLESCKTARYSYKVEKTANGFKAIARSGDGDKNKVLPGCPADEWSIDNDKNLKAENDTVSTCAK